VNAQSSGNVYRQMDLFRDVSGAGSPLFWSKAATPDRAVRTGCEAPIGTAAVTVEALFDAAISDWT